VIVVATGVLASFAGSVRLLRARPVMSLSLGAAVVLGLVASCCGVGALIAPFFLCELLALQLGHALPGKEGPPARHGGWLAACVVLLGAVVLTASVGWLVGLGLGTELLATDAVDRVASSLALPDSAWLLVPVSALGALVFVLPYSYAPHLLIERPMPMIEAMVESARRVRSAGVLSQAALSVCAHALQVAPVVLGSAAAHALAGPELGSLWALFSLPLMVLTIPLGQGMITSSFAAQSGGERATTLEARALPPRARLALALWVFLIVSPLVSFAMLGASLVRPARLSSGELPDRVETLAELTPSDGFSSRMLPGTALTVSARRRGVYVEASDGGGAGKLPLRSRAPIDRVRVGRVRDRYAIAVEQGRRRSLTFVDRAGVRQDDGLRARLDDRLPAYALAFMIAGLLAITLVQLPVLARAGQAWRDGELATRATVISRALLLGSAIAPLAIASLWFGLRALLGL
jgi:hypothetical protein